MKGKVKKIILEVVFIVVLVIFSAPIVMRKTADFLNHKGIEYYNQKRVDKAVVFFKRSLRIKPNSIAYCNLAKAYLDEKETQKAAVEYENAIGSDKTCLEAYYGLADIYKEKRMYKKAKEFLIKVKPVDFDNATIDSLNNVTEGGRDKNSGGRSGY